MTDYGRALQFGVFITPSSMQLDNSYALAELADETLEFIGVQDHPYQPRFLDAWAFMSNILLRTKKVRVVPDVANVPLHNPAVMAKMAASLDVLSGGLWSWPWVPARFGIPSPLWVVHGDRPEKPPRRYATPWRSLG